jgi:hypothetical protein
MSFSYRTFSFWILMDASLDHCVIVSARESLCSVHATALDPIGAVRARFTECVDDVIHSVYITYKAQWHWTPGTNFIFTTAASHAVVWHHRRDEPWQTLVNTD